LVIYLEFVKAFGGLVRTIRVSRPKSGIGGKIMKRLSVLSIFIVLGLHSALAQPFINTYVSTTGSDTATCGLHGLPCATFQQAVNHTILGGNLTALDSGDFGPFNITKSITVDGGPGAMITTIIQGGGISCLQAVAICIDPPGQSTVILRNLSINLFEVSTSCCNFAGVQEWLVNDAPPIVIMENVQISGPGGDCVSDFGGALTFRHGTLSGCGAYGVAASGQQPVLLENVIVTASANGMNIDVYPGATIHNCEITANAGIGIYAEGNTPVTIDSSVVTDNGVGIRSAFGATVQLTNTTVTGNTTGLLPNNGGSIVSFVNNRIYGNATNGAPTSSVYQK
jgi:hypothetical protein